MRVRLAGWSVLALVAAAACGGARSPAQGGAEAASRVAGSRRERPSLPAPAVLPAPPPEVVAKPAPAPGAVAEPAAPVEAGHATPPAAPRLVPGGLARGTGDRVDAALLEGDRAYRSGDLRAARKGYEAAVRLAPEDPAPRVGLLRVAIAGSKLSTDYGAAASDPRLSKWDSELAALLGKHPDFGPALVERGRLALMSGKAEVALPLLTRAAELLPSDPEAHSSLGVAFLALGKASDAVLRFQSAVELEPDEPDRLLNLGTALMMVSRVEDAILAYQRASKLAPEDARAAGNLGTALLAAGRIAEAKPFLERAVSLDGTRATFLSNLGYAQHKLGDLRGALATLDRALRKDPKLVSAWLNKGALLADLGRLREAEAAFRKAQKLDPDDPRPKASLSDLAEIKGRTGSK